MEPLLLTPKQAATLLNICERTLFSLTKKNEIPSIRIGRCVRYSTAALKIWAQQVHNVEIHKAHPVSIAGVADINLSKIRQEERAQAKCRSKRLRDILSGSYIKSQIRGSRKFLTQDIPAELVQLYRAILKGKRFIWSDQNGEVNKRD